LGRGPRGWLCCVRVWPLYQSRGVLLWCGVVRRGSFEDLGQLEQEQQERQEDDRGVPRRQGKKASSSSKADLAFSFDYG
jgi:hypothetical protein